MANQKLDIWDARSAFGQMSWEAVPPGFVDEELTAEEERGIPFSLAL